MPLLLQPLMPLLLQPLMPLLLLLLLTRGQTFP